MVPVPPENDSSQSDELLFKKKLKKLEQYKGRGTELISVYIPADADRSTVTGQLSEEVSQSSNIKSPSTRKNVQGALRKILSFLRQIDFKIPKNGIVVFAGNISETEGRTDIRLFTVKPIKDLRTKRYWCDSSFHLEPLKEMIRPSNAYGLITIDKSEATTAILIGKRYEILGHFTSGVSGKMRAGGQCLSSDTLVQLADGDIIEIKNTHNPMPVLSGDFNNNTTTESVIVDKWENEKIPIKIVTKYPRFEIESSEDHTFFVLEKGQIAEKKAGQLKPGNQIIFPEKIRIKGEPQPLQTHFFNSYSILPEGRDILIKKRKEKNLHQKELAKQIGVTQTLISVIELGKQNTRHGTLYHYTAALGIEFHEFVTKYCKEQPPHRLPAILTPELAQIIGYWLGDGNTEKERVCFSEQDVQVAEHYAKKIREIFNANVRVKHRKNKGYYQIRAYGKPIVKFLQSEFPEKHSACDSEVPKKILKSSNEIVAGFVRGIFDAEGYISEHGIGFGINNQKLSKQLQLVLLRFGIISSFLEYDNRRNPYTKKHRFTLEISEKESLELFKSHMGFTSEKKSGKLVLGIEKRVGRSSVRQMPLIGSDVRKIIEAHGWNKQRFIDANMYLQNRRKISKYAFRKSVVEKAAANPALRDALQKMLQHELLPVEIAKIAYGAKTIPMADISVQSQNFIAQGLIVHNSAARFERLREEAGQEFYKRISEKANTAFVPYGEKLQGIIVGGPGMTKNFFLEKDMLDYRIKGKVLGTIDTGYTDESGIRELVQKSDTLLKDTDLMKEKAIMTRFFAELGKNGLAAYGENEVMKALELGQVEKVLVSEAIEWYVYHVKKNNGDERYIIDKDQSFNENSFKGEEQIEIVEEFEFIDYMVERAANTSAGIEIVSVETPEGEQFYKGFGGIGAMLRYKI